MLVRTLLRHRLCLVLQKWRRLGDHCAKHPLSTVFGWDNASNIVRTYPPCVVDAVYYTAHAILSIFGYKATVCTRPLDHQNKYTDQTQSEVVRLEKEKGRGPVGLVVRLEKEKGRGPVGLLFCKQLKKSK